MCQTWEQKYESTSYKNTASLEQPPEVYLEAFQIFMMKVLVKIANDVKLFKPSS